VASTSQPAGSAKAAGKDGWRVDTRTGDGYTRDLDAWGRLERTMDRGADLDTPVRFSTVALVVTARDSIAGPTLVPGVVQHYDVRHVHGTASVVETVTDDTDRATR
jgi:hypothetical protein